MATQLQEADRVALTGMGGLGKSELALQYAWREWENKTYLGGIVWLTVAESDPGLAILTFAQVHLGLRLPTEGELVERVRFCWQNWLRNEQDQALIIFDDARNYQDIKAYLPPQAEKRFKVIITTRNENLSATIQTLHLELLDQEPALDLLRSYITDDCIDIHLEQAKLLCHGLGYLPLALELVARLLRRRKNWTIQYIRERLAEKGLADQSLQKNPNFDAEMTAQNGVKSAFDLSWEALDSNAQKLSMYLSLFALSPFSKSLIDALLFEQVPEQLEEWLTDSLVNLNLVSDLGDNRYELHTLIRYYLREKLEASALKNEAKRAYCRMMIRIAQQIEQTLTLEDVARFEPLIDHLKIVTEELEQCLEDEDLFGAFASLGLFYKGQGLYNEAVPYFEQCLSVTEQRLGKNHPDVASSLNNLASLYRAQGKYTEAETLYQQSLMILKQQLGVEHPDVVRSLNNLAELYRAQGKYTEAETLYEQSLTILKQQSYKNPFDIIAIIENVAALSRTQGKYEEAETLYRRSLTIRENLLGKEHLLVATSLNNLGVLYCSQQKYVEAELFYRRSLAIREKNLEKNHPDVATSLNNLAGLYDSQGKYAEAEPLYERAISIFLEKLGENHPDLATSLHNLAHVYYQQNRYIESESLCLRALKIREKNLEEGHPYIVTSLNGLAILYYAQEKYAEAEPLYRRSLEIREKQLGADHPLVATSLNNLASLYRAQGKYTEAEPLYQRAIAIFSATLGENHPNTQTVKENYFLMLSQFPDEELNRRFSPEMVEDIQSLRQIKP